MPSRHDRRGQEVVAEKERKRVADPVLVSRDDGRVRDWQAERMAKQRRDGEPVGHAADHRGFGKRLNDTERGMDWLVKARHKISYSHREQQPGRNDAHLGGATLHWHGKGKAGSDCH